MVKVLAFDIGIKNLAWCCLDWSPESKAYKILEWDNYNLLSDSSNVSSVKTKRTCSKCAGKAAYTTADTEYCSRHCPAEKPALRDASGNLLKKLPKVADCKAILLGKNPTQKLPAKAAAIQEALAAVYSLPIVVQKVSKAPDVGLTEIHNSIQRLVSLHKDLWSTCTTILLENQPAFKNPTMKSVQILLFATIRDLLQQPPPSLKLVHAGKKVQGAEKGDAGYKDRKTGSEARAAAFLKDSALLDGGQWNTVWASAAKKSDLADALSMCIDSVVTSSDAATV
jgi:hypothetical protein